jgi:hypothetical protein
MKSFSFVKCANSLGTPSVELCIQNIIQRQVIKAAPTIVPCRMDIVLWTGNTFSYMDGCSRMDGLWTEKQFFFCLLSHSQQGTY